MSGGASWTVEELDYLAANMNRPVEILAESLGRTVWSVFAKRRKLGFKRGGSIHPGHIGSRSLIAKTCTRCGLLLASKWFVWFSGSRSWSSHCKGCRAKAEADRRSALGLSSNDANRVSLAKQQAISLPTADRNGEPYLEADHAVLCREDMTLLQKAIALRRTFNAVRSQCIVNGYRSSVALGDPGHDRWLIDNPNLANLDQITSSLHLSDGLGVSA